MATVSVVRYQRKKKIGDDKSPMVYVLKPKPGESKLYSIESLAREIESIGSLSVEDVEHVMQSFVRSMKKVLVAGNKVKVDFLYHAYLSRCGTGKGLYGEEYHSCQPSFQGR